MASELCVLEQGSERKSQFVLLFEILHRILTDLRHPATPGDDHRQSGRHSFKQ
jgi:hypothetical protein